LLQVQFTENYPEEMPMLKLDRQHGNIELKSLAMLRDCMISEAQNSLGYPMIFNVVAAIEDSISSVLAQSIQPSIPNTDERIEEREEAFAAPVLPFS